jgi:hypothetical protein
MVAHRNEAPWRLLGIFARNVAVVVARGLIHEKQRSRDMWDCLFWGAGGCYERRVSSRTSTGNTSWTAALHTLHLIFTYSSRQLPGPPSHPSILPHSSLLLSLCPLFILFAAVVQTKVKQNIGQYEAIPPQHSAYRRLQSHKQIALGSICLGRQPTSQLVPPRRQLLVVPLAQDKWLSTFKVRIINNNNNNNNDDNSFSPCFKTEN